MVLYTLFFVVSSNIFFFGCWQLKMLSDPSLTDGTKTSVPFLVRCMRPFMTHSFCGSNLSFNKRHTFRIMFAEDHVMWQAEWYTMITRWLSKFSYHPGTRPNAMHFYLQRENCWEQKKQTQFCTHEVLQSISHMTLFSRTRTTIFQLPLYMNELPSSSYLSRQNFFLHSFQQQLVRLPSSQVRSQPQSADYTRRNKDVFCSLILQFELLS